MPNEHVNKVVLGNETMMDITDTTADAADVASGEVFYAKSGARSLGTASYAGAPANNGNANVANAILYGTVDSTSTSTAYTATVSGLTQLVDGTCVMLHNGVVTSASGFTVNINNLGAKKCYNNLTNATQDTTIFNIAYTMMFVYAEDLDEGNGGWWIYRGYDANTNTIGYQVRTNSGNKVAADKGYRYRIWFTSADGTKWVPANTSSSTNATSNRSMNTRAIDPFGPIIYRPANGTCDADTGLGATGIWQQYVLNIGYSYMASGFSLTFPAPVYVKCTPNADGSATMSSIVQALPSSNDGKIYIYLGTAYSATNMELEICHPVYYHDGTGIRQWTGASGGGSSVEPATATPSMDGTAAVGSSTKYAREDHVHPTDTSRQATLVSGTNIKTINNESLLGSGNINVGGSASWGDVTGKPFTSSTVTVGVSNISWVGDRYLGSIASAYYSAYIALYLSVGVGDSITMKINNVEYEAEVTYTSEAYEIQLSISNFDFSSAYCDGNNFYMYNGSQLQSIPTISFEADVETIKNSEIPIASSSSIGGVKIGSGLSIGTSGTLSVIGDNWYGTCSTAAATATKTSYIIGFSLRQHTVVVLQMLTANTYASGALKLNISSTGDRTVYVNNAATSSSNKLLWNAGDVLTFIYDGIYWRYVCTDISFGSSTTTFLANNGTWQTPSGGGGDVTSDDVTVDFLSGIYSSIWDGALYEGMYNALVDYLSWDESSPVTLTDFLAAFGYAITNY